MIQILQSRDFDKLAGNRQVFAEISNVEPGEEIIFLVKYFFMDGDTECFKTTEFAIEGDPSIKEIDVMHTHDEFSLVGREEKGPYKLFSRDFSEEIYARITSYFDREIILAESRE